MLSIFDQSKIEITQKIERSQLNCPVYYMLSVGHGISYLGIRKSLKDNLSIHSIEYPMDYDDVTPKLLNTGEMFVCLNTITK